VLAELIPVVVAVDAVKAHTLRITVEAVMVAQEL
jgi:hypothetical protein